MTEQLDEVTGLSRKSIIESRIPRRGRASASRTTRARPRTDQHRAARPATSCRSAPTSSSTTATRSRPATSSPTSRARPPRPRTSPAVCRAWPSSSRRASPRSTRSSRDRRHGLLRQGHQGQAQGDRHARGGRQAAPRSRKEYLIAKGKHISVHPGDRVKAGEPLMDGAANPHDILNVLGEKELASYLVDEVQEVYRLQGVKINDKHIETIVRQMLRRVRVIDVGDTNFLVDEQVEKHIFEEENERVLAEGGKPPWASRCCSASPRRRSPPSPSSRRRRSRRPPRCSPRPPSPARSTTCAASRRTSSWAGSSPPAPVSPLQAPRHRGGDAGRRGRGGRGGAGNGRRSGAASDRHGGRRRVGRCRGSSGGDEPHGSSPAFFCSAGQVVPDPFLAAQCPRRLRGQLGKDGVHHAVADAARSHRCAERGLAAGGLLYELADRAR